MGQPVRKSAHTKVNGCISSDSDREGADAPLEYNNRSDQRPTQHGHPGTDHIHTQQTESREAEVGHKRRSIDRRDNDRGVTSFVVCGRDEGECHLAIVEVLLRGLTAGVPWLSGKCGMETVGLNGEQGILMVGWFGVGV